MPPKLRRKQWSDLPHKGPPVRALCLGINAYDHLENLVNCEQDADEWSKKVEKLPDGGNGNCRATVLTGSKLASKEDMEKAVRDFAKDIDKRAPPRMVMISYSGHGFQDGEDILMAPSGTSKEPHKRKTECMSHNTLFSILYEEMHKQIEVT